MSDAHQLLDKLLENLKTDLMKNLTERIKNEILAEVELKNKALVQDMVNILDKIHREIVDEVVKENKKLVNQVEKMNNQKVKETEKKENVLMSKMQEEVKQEMEKFADVTTAAMDDCMADMRSRIYFIVENEVAIQLREMEKRKDGIVLHQKSSDTKPAPESAKEEPNSISLLAIVDK